MKPVTGRQRIAERLEAQRAGEADWTRWEAWSHTPPEIWPPDTMRGFLVGTGREHELCRCAPTGAEMRAIVNNALGGEAVLAPLGGAFRSWKGSAEMARFGQGTGKPFLGLAEAARQGMICRQVAAERSQTGVGSADAKPAKAPGVVSAERARDEMVRRMRSR